MVTVKGQQVGLAGSDLKCNDRARYTRRKKEETWRSAFLYSAALSSLFLSLCILCCYYGSHHEHVLDHDEIKEQLVSQGWLRKRTQARHARACELGYVNLDSHNFPSEGATSVKQHLLYFLIFLYFIQNILFLFAAAFLDRSFTFWCNLLARSIFCFEKSLFLTPRA